jgi:hypothetical protein
LLTVVKSFVLVGHSSLLIVNPNYTQEVPSECQFFDTVFLFSFSAAANFSVIEG